MRMILDEQDLCDSICLSVAEQTGAAIERTDAEVFLLDNGEIAGTGSASYISRTKGFDFSSQDIVNAIGVYFGQLGFDPEGLEVTLEFVPEVGFQGLVTVLR